MFSLSKSLAQLKSAVEGANLSKQEAGDDSSKGKQNVVTIKKKSDQQKKVGNKNVPNGGGRQKRGVIMIKNFPHGFYEKQMFDYFSQFGQVTRLKIVRSRKTGNPRNYGFIEFQFEDVAKIAAETMNNYIMFDHIVKCNLLSEEKVPKNLFHNWNRPFISSIKTHKVAHNLDKSSDKEYSLLCKRLKRVHAMEKALSDKGIEFKCVIVNRPTGLHKKKTDSEPKATVVSTKASKPMKEIAFKSPMTSLAKSGLVSHRRLMLPKFMVIKAGFNYKA